MTPPVVVTSVASNGFTIFADVYFAFGAKRVHLRSVRVRWTDDTYWDFSAPRVRVAGDETVNAFSIPPSWERAAVAAILVAARAEGIAA